MKMARVILFTGQMDAMSKFYGEVLGLKQVSEEPAGANSTPAARGSHSIRFSAPPAISRRAGR